MNPSFNKEITISNYNITKSNSEELLGVVIDSEVTFVKHIKNLCRKKNQTPCIGESSQVYDFRKAPLRYENIFHLHY